jgi:hypothetical protein
MGRRPAYTLVFRANMTNHTGAYVDSVSLVCGR